MSSSPTVSTYTLNRIMNRTDNDINDDVYSPMKAENTQLQETEWTGDRQTY